MDKRNKPDKGPLNEGLKRDISQGGKKPTTVPPPKPKKSK